MKKLLVLTIASILFTACKEEIDFEYNTVNPIDVIEAYLTQDGLDITVSKTLDMKVTDQSQPVDYELTLTNRAGNAVDTAEAPIVGEEYTLSVTVGSNTYTSCATMHSPTTIESAEFIWQEIMGRESLYFNVLINDIKGENNCYCFRMYRNGEIYNWGAFTDLGYKDGIINLPIICMTREAYEEDEPEMQKRILHDGDTIRFEVITIDETTYDYIYSLGLSKSQSYNPIHNFKGGCLGYFLVGGITSIEKTFIYEEKQ